MNYIVLDLEWNQCPGGKEKENKELPFEIVEIGAVKLDENRRYVDEFHQFVSPVVYRTLHRITHDIIKLTIEDLDEGEKFLQAAEHFFKWCDEGGEYVFCTWGTMDLTELQRNCKYFDVKHKFDKPLVYYDIQKLYSLCFSDGKTRVSLETAIDEQEIEKDIPFHAAVYDAIYTSRVFEKIDFDRYFPYTSVDTYRIPKNRSEEYNFNYGTYSKYVSRGFTDKDRIMKDGSVLSMKCYLCGKNVRKKIRWFSGNQKMYYALGFCEEHGYLKGKIKMRKTDDNMFYAIKILKLTDENGAAQIRQRQLAARQKRRERRHRESEKLHAE